MPIDEIQLDEEEKQLMAEEPIEEVPVETPVETPAPVEEPKPVEAPKVEAPKEEPKPSKEQEIITNLQKALKETRHEFNERTNRFKTEFEELKSRITQPPAPKAPDPNEDPLGHQNYQIEQIREEQRKTNEQVQQTTQVAESQKFALHVQNLENTFKSQVPDYDKAFQYVQEFRKGELEDMGVTDPEIINREIGRMAYNISVIALRNGENPAAVIYKQAKRFGYKNEPAPQPKSELETALSTVKPTERLDAVAHAQEKVGNSPSSGDSPDDNISVENLLKANGSDFNKLWEQYFDKEINK